MFLKKSQTNETLFPSSVFVGPGSFVVLFVCVCVLCVFFVFKLNFRFFTWCCPSLHFVVVVVVLVVVVVVVVFVCSLLC